MKQRLCQVDGVTRSGVEFTAGAVWQLDNGVWSCVDAAPIIRWMIGRDPAAIHRYMRGMGWHWQWIGPPVDVERPPGVDQPGAVPSGFPPEPPQRRRNE